MSRVTDLLAILGLVAACAAWSVAKVESDVPTTPDDRIEAAFDDLDETLKEIEELAKERATVIRPGKKVPAERRRER